MKILSIDVGIYNLAICILNVNEKCNGCGGCLETDYFEETSEGFAKAKEGIII